MDNTEQQLSALVKGKDFLVLIPLLGSALAITYDVGYFAGVNIKLFTLFSLSEHIVFALEVLPESLLMAFCIGLLGYYHKPLGQKLKASRSGWNLTITLIAALTLCTNAVAILLFNAYVAAIGAAIAACFLATGMARSRSVLGRVVLVGAGAAVMAYVLGYTAGSVFLYPNAGDEYFARHYSIITTIETKADGRLGVKLIRSGERGVLFFEEKTKQVTLLRWDEIRQISTARAP